jgi:hypothetical protein
LEKEIGMVILSVAFVITRNPLNTYLLNAPLAKVVWRIIHMNFGLAPQKKIANLFVAQRYPKTRVGSD